MHRYEKRMFVAVAGEEFIIHVPGPNINMADPSGFIGGTTYDFKVSEDGKDIIWQTEKGLKRG